MQTEEDETPGLFTTNEKSSRWTTRGLDVGGHLLLKRGCASRINDSVVIYRKKYYLHKSTLRCLTYQIVFETTRTHARTQARQ